MSSDSKHSEARHDVPAPELNASPDEITAILKSTKVIAMVGASDNSERPSYDVMNYLLSKGFAVIPVAPGGKKIQGQQSYAALKEIPSNIKIDVVDVFRKLDAVPEVVDEALARGTRVIWLQRGLVHNESARKAKAKGVQVVMDKCMKIEHRDRAQGASKL